MDEAKIKELIKQALEEKGKSNEPEKEPDNKIETNKSVQELLTKFSDTVVAAIQQSKGGNNSDGEYLKNKLFNPNNGFQAIQYPSADQMKNLTDDQKIVLFFKSLVMRDKDPEADVVFKALVEGTNSEGGFLVPTPLANQVWRILPDIAVMRKLATVMPMTADTLGLNSLIAKPKAYWTAEYGNKTTTSAEFGQGSLNVNDLVCLIPVTHQLVADANIDIVNLIVTLFAEAIGEAEDKAFFTGSGSGQPRGISQESLMSVAAGASLDFDDIINVIGRTPQRVRKSPNTAFVGGRRSIELLRKVKDTTGNYIWRDGASGRMSGQTEMLPDMLYGYPFYEQNDLAESEIYFGDWKYYIIGDRQQITVEQTTVGGDAWRRNSLEIKAVERVDGRAVLTSAFAKITGV